MTILLFSRKNTPRFKLIHSSYEKRLTIIIIDIRLLLFLLFIYLSYYYHRPCKGLQQIFGETI
ncbi:hypothetical protein BDV30DRAFT_203107 [Aspergillus minisclerotigenes]|uniref:Uncharacterized protein n=1 Tax=Aspergillus minisclerotigenes TaxID=656917 RepID=A0A5N6JL40_9EURO|nr:hypothetical protein BDV30DRAFT_203107 [Aspergillus minisclerotigenes]